MIPHFDNGGFYFSDIGLYEFQEIGVAEAYLRGNALAVWDTGIGKSHLGMASTAMLFEDDIIDLLIVICEGNKTDEWIADFTRFTTISATLYHGTKRLTVLSPETKIIVTTYDTFKRDCATFVVPPGKIRAVAHPGVITPFLEGKRCFFIFDEITRLKNRRSGTYKAIDYAVQNQRQWETRTLGLTATPMDTSPENIFNICRLLDPVKMPKIGEFEKYFTFGVDSFGKLQWKPSKLPELHQLFAPMVMRKRKSDPDVIDQFPKQIEESTIVKMEPDHALLYHEVEQWSVPENLFGAHWMLLRQLAAYPESVIRTVQASKAKNEVPSELGVRLLAEYGEEELRRISSSKAIRMVSYLSMLVRGQGEKVLVFTNFGPSVGPLLARDLRNGQIKVYPHFPPLDQAVRTVNKQAFRENKVPGVLLSSDAGSRGMNVPEASYVVHYEMPLTFSTYRQRSDRNHRIDSKLPAVTSMAFILKDTVEEDISVVCMDRNADQDVILGDSMSPHHIHAAVRREALRIADQKR